MEFIHKFSRAYGIKKSPHSDYIVTLSESMASIWDSKTWEKVAVFKEINHPSEICFANNSDLLAIKSTSGRIGVFNLSTMQHIVSHTPTKREGVNMFFSPDDQYIISGDWDGNVYLFDWKNNKSEILLQLKDEGCELIIFRNIDRINNNKFVFSFWIIHGRDDFYHRIIWEYPFHDNQYLEKKYKRRYEYDKFNVNKIIYAVKHDNVKKIIICDSDFNAMSEIIINGSFGNEDIIDFNWAPDGEHIIVVSSPRVMDTYSEEFGFGYIRVIRIDDKMIIKEYKLKYVGTAEITKDNKYLLIATGESGYYINAEEIFN